MFDPKKTAADVAKLVKEITETIDSIEKSRHQKLERLEELRCDMEANADAMNLAMETGDQESFIRSQMRQKFLQAQIEKIENSTDDSNVQRSEKEVRQINDLMETIASQMNAFVPEVIEQAEKEDQEMKKQYDTLRKLKINLMKTATGKLPDLLGSFGGPLPFNKRVIASLKTPLNQIYR